MTFLLNPKILACTLEMHSSYMMYRNSSFCSLSLMLRANDDNLMNVFDALLVAKQDINIMLLTDPCDCITTSANVWE